MLQMASVPPPRAHLLCSGVILALQSDALDDPIKGGGGGVRQFLEREFWEDSPIDSITVT